jgi:Xaa-Pro aminopeptidase
MDFSSRLTRARTLTSHEGLDALLITPGPDLRYLVGYDAVPLERLTCLIIPSEADPFIVVPELERLAAQASPAGDLGLAMRTWNETDDPYSLVAKLLGQSATVGLDNHMWAEKVLAFRAAMPGSEQRLAESVVGAMRMRKDAGEVMALREAGAAIDHVHALVPTILRPGITESQAGQLIGDAIIQAGHVRVDFIIVASGPNGASPHHEVSDRVMQLGDCVVVDIGGTMPSGYRSDCTRTYVLGQAPESFVDAYASLQQSQAAASRHARPGVSCESIDSAARDVLANSGLGELFVHRTGHGIGLETHEAPYMVAGNSLILEPGMAFSIEPGFYLEGHYGARIEDIVIVTEAGAESVNHQPRELIACV